jgi:hypothetical protein
VEHTEGKQEIHIKFDWKILRKRHFEDTGVDERIILKWMF